MTEAQRQETARPTVDPSRASVEMASPPRRRTTARIRRPANRVDELRQTAATLTDRGLQVDVAAKELCGIIGDDRPLLSEVYLAQLRYMRNRPADDFHATATLGIIERALAQLPRPVPPLAPPRWAPPVPRRVPWLYFGRRNTTTGAA